MGSSDKLSTTGQGIVSPIVAYSSNKEVASVAPHLIRVIRDGIVGGNSFPSITLDGDALEFKDPDPVIPPRPRGPVGPVGPQGPAEQFPEEDMPGWEVFPGWDAPSLTDVELISNEVVYDSAGKPTVKVVFKVGNSSGKKVKSVNARVQVI